MRKANVEQIRCSIDYPGINIELKFLKQEQRDLGCCSLPDWLVELSHMRGRVAYDDGRRPFFRLPDGSFDDPDPSDLEAYHVVARHLGRPVGCARVVPLTDGGSCALSSVLGERLFDAILSQVGATRSQSCEASRWIVVPEWRNGLGGRIVAASFAVQRWLARKFAFVLAGTRQKQDCALIHMGARVVEGLPLFPSEPFDDDLRLLFFDADHPSQQIEQQIRQEASAMKLQLASPAEIIYSIRESAIPVQAE